MRSTEWQAGAAAAEQMVDHQAGNGLTADQIQDNHDHILHALGGHEPRTDAEAGWLAGWAETTAECVQALRELAALDQEAGTGRS